MTNLAAAAWVKSSYSDHGGNCVEVAPGYPSLLPVRDSKNPEGPVLVFTAESFSTFLASVKVGSFNAL
ncbi:DUF397 domain-containing protein [Kitasatospora sp. NPDC006697]|uniref:DUF397 domain-containing protein n=1 Tax=Kitasatospora sp. NPDC006697 TaxID=3364020 RepID=UPI00367B0714